MDNLPAMNADWIVNTYLLTPLQAGGQVLPYDPTRFAVTFSAANAANVWLAIGSNPGNGIGIGLNSTVTTQHFNFRDWPGMVAGPWFASSTGQPYCLYVVEMLYRPQQE